MTCIVYRNGVMAADSRGYSGNHSPIGTKTKIRRLADGTLIGCSSNKPGQPEAVMDWYAAGADQKETPCFIETQFVLLVVKPTGEAFLFDDRFYPAGPFLADFYAIGSGRDYAYGAMHMGAGPERAVEIGIELDCWSGGPITSLTHDEG